MATALTRATVALPSIFEHRDFILEYERREKPGADWTFRHKDWDGDPECRLPRGHHGTAGECIEQIADWLAEQAEPLSVAKAIAQHRTAFMANEASFDDEGLAFDDAAAELTEKAECEAFDAFLRAPCTSLTDIQAKLAYALSRPIGERESNANGLSHDLEEAWDVKLGPKRLRLFLTSLQVEQPEAEL